MLVYAVGLLAVLLVLYNNGTLAPAASRAPQMRRTPRPLVQEHLLALDDWPANLTCSEDHGYAVHLFSKEPLVVYVEGFLDAAERAHLLEISEPLFEPSTITHDGGAATHRDQTIRDSEVAVIPRTPAVRCIEARARALQGWRQEQWIERLRTQRYRPGGHYSHHFDWSSSFGGWGRVSSFMVWVAADHGDDTEAAAAAAASLVGGGTEFPLLKPLSADDKWCRFIECDKTAAPVDGEQQPLAEGVGGAGVVFKPIAGNAVYWENFRPDGTGRGWDATWHAGLPVLKGTKVGLNIWTWGRID